MTSLDSMFLFEIELSELKLYDDVGKIALKATFANFFDMFINEPIKTSLNKVKQKHRTKVRNKLIKLDRATSKTTVQTEHSILITTDPYLLLNNMMLNQFRFSVWSRKPFELIGAADIPWSQVFFEYLSKIINHAELLDSTCSSGIYSVFNEQTLEELGLVQLNIKLTYFGNKQGLFSNMSPETDKKSITELSKDNNASKYGTIRTLYNGKPKRKLKKVKPKSHNTKKTTEANIQMHDSDVKHSKDMSNIDMCCKLHELHNEQGINDDLCKLIKISKSLSSITKRSALDFKPLRYIFGDPEMPFVNKVYWVNYFTVDKQPSDPGSSKSSSDNVSEPSTKKYRFKICDSECQVMKNRTGSDPPSTCSIDIPKSVTSKVNVGKCKRVQCEKREHRKVPPPIDDRIFLDLKNLEKECCDGDNIDQKVEEVVGGVKAKIQISEDPCFCTCECTFGFVKKTTYCKVCGGYEAMGEDLTGIERADKFPCPYFHKLVDRNKGKSRSTSGSEGKKKQEDNVSVKGMRVTSNQKATASEKQRMSDKKSVESEKETKKSKPKKDERFKFNYGYKGIPPQIGHSRCALPCTGKLGNVPKHMGWLWTAEDIPGMKFRPMWRPGGANKHVVRLLKIARNPGEVTSKKRKKESHKRPLKRPLLIVHKKDGEFTVTMETMKTYARPRAVNQNPYEDKPVLTYTIGRTEEENLQRRKKKERKQRRLQREQRDFIQSAFKDMCHEICLKTYQQALGILPDAEDPQCACYPALPGPDRTNLDVSCSCSEEKTSIGSDTDSDEWILEFTPPNATFYPNFKTKKLFKAENGTQYTYLDYRVKLLDRYGNPVPRFFKGPDGKEQCSDLGGFWSPEHKWLEINVDGYVAPDARWAPISFIGPNGEHIDAEEGKFQTLNNKWLIVGIDGFVDCQGKWKFYPKPRGIVNQKKSKGTSEKKKQGPALKREEKSGNKSDTTWSCFGDVSPKYLSELGIMGHSYDKKLLLSSLKDLLAQGENVKIPQPSLVYRLPHSKRGKQRNAVPSSTQRLYEERTKCNHPVPSDKGIVAVDDRGRKTYFRLKDPKNNRPGNRMKTLVKQGISLSSFHIPCFHSFINSEVMKQQQHDRLIALGKNIATQI